MTASLDARLPDGTALHLRPLRDAERSPVLEVFEQMSSRSRYLRFLSPVPRLSETVLRQLTTLDDHRHVAWAAYDGARCVAIARFVRWPDRPDAAELAVSVIDAMHRRGVGRLLLSVLAAVAAGQGITTFTLTVHPENGPSLALARSLGGSFRFVDGEYVGTLPTAAVLADGRLGQTVDPRVPADSGSIPAPRRPGPQLPVPSPSSPARAA